MKALRKFIEAITILLLFFGVLLVLGIFMWTKRYEGKKPPNESTSGVENITGESSSSTGDEKETTSKNNDDKPLESFVFELPVKGSSGYAATLTEVYKEDNLGSEVVLVMQPGQAFCILEEVGEWWNIVVGDEVGWVKHEFCFINLPDIIPSIIYEISNSNSSLFKSSGKAIPNITGEELYSVYLYNARFDKMEYVVPVLYSMAPKIYNAQQAALADGNTLVIYEAYRPGEVQQQVVLNLRELMQKDTQVRKGIEQDSWNIGWFISTGISNHQRGYAIDVTIAKVIIQEEKSVDGYTWTDVVGYREFIMPSAMHELSVAAISMEEPVNSRDVVAWKNVEPSANMNAYSMLLRKYCTEAGMTPLASEWWHFNDFDNSTKVNAANVIGNFFITENVSMGIE